MCRWVPMRPIRDRIKQGGKEVGNKKYCIWRSTVFRPPVWPSPAQMRRLFGPCSPQHRATQHLRFSIIWNQILGMSIECTCNTMQQVVLVCFLLNCWLTCQWLAGTSPLTHAKPRTAVLLCPTCHLNNFHHLSNAVMQSNISLGNVLLERQRILHVTVLKCHVTFNVGVGLTNVL